MLELAKNRDGDRLTVTLRIEPEEFVKALGSAYMENSERFPSPAYAARLSLRGRRSSGSTARQHFLTRRWVSASPSFTAAGWRKTR